LFSSVENSGKSVKQLDEQLLHQLQLNAVCVGVQVGMADVDKHKNFWEFYKHFDGLFSNGLSGMDREKAWQILGELEKDVQGNVVVPVADTTEEARR
jgi:hypothetical protein